MLSLDLNIYLELLKLKIIIYIKKEIGGIGGLGLFVPRKRIFRQRWAGWIELILNSSGFQFQLLTPKNRGEIPFSVRAPCAKSP